MSLQLFSNSFAEGGWIPELHSCKGADLSPSLEWSGEPGDARSFALVVEDPDAPSGTFCHWLLYDIPPHVHNLAQGLKPGLVGVTGTNDFGRPGYGGPCPPKGIGAPVLFPALCGRHRHSRFAPRSGPQGILTGFERAHSSGSAVYGPVSTALGVPTGYRYRVSTPPNEKHRCGPRFESANWSRFSTRYCAMPGNSAGAGRDMVKACLRCSMMMT